MSTSFGVHVYPTIIVRIHRKSFRSSKYALDTKFLARALFELKVTGAIGLISHMEELGLLTANDLDQTRVKIRNSGFYLSKKLCDELDRICSK